MPGGGGEFVGTTVELVVFVMGPFEKATEGTHGALFAHSVNDNDSLSFTMVAWDRHNL